MKSLPVFLALLCLVLTACTPPNQGTEFEDEKNPYFRAAAKYASEGNYYAAVAEYEKALAANPNVAKAHVEMGMLYGDKLGDPVSAIYHFQKYQGARPSAPDQEQVKTLIEKSKVDFLLTLPNSGMQNAEEVARISRENADLKQSLAKAQGDLSDLQAQLAQSQAKLAELQPPAKPAETNPAPAPAEGTTPPADPATASAPAPAEGTPASSTTTATAPDAGTPAAAPAPEATAVKSYTVKSGDSLWKISATNYPKDIKGGIEKIREANPFLGKSNALKPGQVLVIP